MSANHNWKTWYRDAAFTVVCGRLCVHGNVGECAGHIASDPHTSCCRNCRFDQHYKIRSGIGLRYRTTLVNQLRPKLQVFPAMRANADQERGVHADDQDNQPVAFNDV
ncbi:AVN_HP_G0120040.mRNA.1.CDS.1 [Saccharomyces cerevisiae]|nr:AVN_HP_G0120040.mRNA.1.CDS.1 [Saccharomyces cerevisiae]CAI6997133.1 AVN_HP_G0120040.mRNA.1.CDS.1 [Saccharomyces cerevisiae]